MTLHNIANYKKSIIVVKDLEKILKIVNATESSLRGYSKYTAVRHILTTITEEKAILEMYLAQYKVVLETKGQKGL